MTIDVDPEVQKQIDQKYDELIGLAMEKQRIEAIYAAKYKEVYELVIKSRILTEEQTSKIKRRHKHEIDGQV